MSLNIVDTVFYASLYKERVSFLDSEAKKVCQNRVSNLTQQKLCSQCNWNFYVNLLN